MQRPAIQVVLACPCMANNPGQIDWIPGEYRVLKLAEVTELLKEHERHEFP